METVLRMIHIACARDDTAPMIHALHGRLIMACVGFAIGLYDGSRTSSPNHTEGPQFQKIPPTQLVLHISLQYG
jgi:hypothetical protein